MRSCASRAAPILVASRDLEAASATRFRRLPFLDPRLMVTSPESAAFESVCRFHGSMPERFVFTDLRELFAKANEEKSGDQLAGLAAQSERERVAAKRKLADLTLAEIVERPLIDPADDDVSQLIFDTVDKEAFGRIKSMTVGGFREYILDDATGEVELKKVQWAIIPEIAAAAAKIMSNKDLVLAARKIRNVTRCRNTMGEPGVLGIRVQPNHPVDDVGGISAL